MGSTKFNSDLVGLGRLGWTRSCLVGVDSGRSDRVKSGGLRSELGSGLFV